MRSFTGARCAGVFVLPFQQALSTFDATRNQRVKKVVATKGAFAVLLKRGILYAWGSDQFGTFRFAPPLVLSGPRLRFFKTSVYVVQVRAFECPRKSRTHGIHPPVFFALDRDGKKQSEAP